MHLRESRTSKFSGGPCMAPDPPRVEAPLGLRQMYPPVTLKYPLVQKLIETPVDAESISLLLSKEAAWPSGQRVGLAIRRSRVRVPLWPLAGFVLGRPEFRSSATLVNSQPVAFCHLEFLILLCCI